MKAIAAKRPVLAKFRLTDQEWDLFSKFYARNRRDVLTVNDIDIRQRPPGAKLGGHAVVLTSFNSDCLRFMNSWGTNWADNGFFRVRNADVLDVKFVDVYWTLNDLTTSEIEEYNRQGPQITEKLLASLKGLHNATFKCPLCNQISKVTEFTGQLVRATCPKCRGVFDTNSHKMHDLVLNMYLTSLCQ
jgi:phage FluMu protein Com